MSSENSLSIEEANKIERLPIPVYSPDKQIHSSPSDKAEHFRNASLDAIDRERRRVNAEIAKKTGHNLRSYDGHGLDWAIDHTDPTVGEHFSTHGFRENKGALNDLDKILTQGIDSDRILYSMPFSLRDEVSGVATAYGASRPFDSGGIYLIADYDKQLSEKDGGIKYVGVGASWVGAIDEMQRQWPQVKFVPWHDLPKVLTERVNEVTGSNLNYETLTDDNRPYYRNMFLDSGSIDNRNEKITDVNINPNYTEIDPDEVF